MALQIPEGFVGRYAYAPPGDASGEPWIVALVDRRYMLAGMIVQLSGTLVLVGNVVLSAGRGSDALLVWLLCLVVGVALRTFGGRAGFYELAPDGTLGERISRTQPDVTGWRRVAVRRGVIGD